MIFPDVFVAPGGHPCAYLDGLYVLENIWKYHRDSMHIQMFFASKNFPGVVKNFPGVAENFSGKKKLHMQNHDDISRCFSGTRHPPLRLS